MTIENSPVSDHLHIVMIGLVYPAILGAFIYELVMKYGGLGCFQLILAGTLVIHFAIDYAHTSDDESKEIYNSLRFILDILILIALYKIMRLAIDVDVKNYGSILFWLLWFKTLSIGWEWCGQRTNDRCEVTVVSIIFFGCYLLLYLCFKENYYYLVGLLILDTLSYAYWNHCYEKWEKFMTE